MSGYFGVGIYNTKTVENVGTLWRSALIFDAAFVFTIGKRYKKQASDTLKTSRYIPLINYPTFEEFQKCRPDGCQLIGVEQTEKSIPLDRFVHPQRVIYLLGAEDHGLPPAVLEKCQSVVSITTRLCLNVAVAGSIVMYSRGQSPTVSKP